MDLLKTALVAVVGDLQVAAEQLALTAARATAVQAGLERGGGIVVAGAHDGISIQCMDCMHTI